MALDTAVLAHSSTRSIQTHSHKLHTFLSWYETVLRDSLSPSSRQGDVVNNVNMAPT